MQAIRSTLVILCLWFACAGALASESDARRAMHITVRLSNAKSTATGFILTRDSGGRVLVTAAHVLERAAGETVTVVFRKQDEQGTWTKVPTPLKIRSGKDRLWQQHPAQDVAAMALEVPEGVEVPSVSVDTVATAADIESLDPGELVRCIGYPHGAVFEPNQAAFPVVRLGCIASFPLSEKTFLVDYKTFEGDSGGMIYWQGAAGFKIIGIVHGQHWVNHRLQSPYESFEMRRQLGLAIITHADAVRETIEMVP